MNDVLTPDEQVEQVNTATAPTQNFDDPNSADYVGEPAVVDKEFVYVGHLDTARQSDRTGVYLDDVQRRQAEITRAQIENREPDLDNPPATQGTPMVTVAQATKDYSTQAVNGALEKAVTLPVSVGIADENLDGYGDAIKRRHEASGAEEPVVNPNEGIEQSEDTEQSEGTNQEVGDPESTGDDTGENKTVTFS